MVLPGESDGGDGEPLGSDDDGGAGGIGRDVGSGLFEEPPHHCVRNDMLYFCYARLVT